jgi:hypothetical protein
MGSEGLPGRWALGGFVVLAALASTGCPWNAAGSTGCQPIEPARPLPEILKESSGVAWSLARPGVIYSHNDGGDDPYLYALDSSGNLQARIPLAGIENRDWEDMATARCDAGSCIYLADTGDNYARWAESFLYRIVDSGSLEETTRAVESYPVILPDGARDIEALFILPGEQVHFITKGRHEGSTIYRYPLPLRPGEAVTLELVQTLSEDPMLIPAQITGADASADGKIVVVRSYQDMTFYGVENGLLLPIEGGTVDLGTLGEAQGESVAIGPDGQLVLTTEAGNFGGMAALQILECGILKGH